MWATTCTSPKSSWARRRDKCCSRHLTLRVTQLAWREVLSEPFATHVALKGDSAPMGERLQGKVGVVTGGASGIGAESARRFVAEGARVVLGDLNTDALAHMRDELGD